MHASFDLSHVDFRTTPVENIFLDTYVAHAPEAALRVYLMGWKACYEAQTADIDAARLAEGLGLRPEELEAALAYWEGEGLLSRETDGRVVFRSMLLLWAGVGDLPKATLKPASEAVEAPGAARQNGVPPATRETGMTRTAMFDALEDFLSQGFRYRVVLKDNEIRLILDVMDTYAFTPEYFLYAYKKAHASGEATARSVKYITTIVENWARFDGITTVEGLDQYLAEKEKVKPVRRSKRRQEKNVDRDTRMTREEEREWVKKKLEASRKRDLRGGKQ